MRFLLCPPWFHELHVHLVASSPNFMGISPANIYRQQLKEIPG